MKDIIIIGAGGFGREVLMLIQAINRKSKAFNFLGFIDDGVNKGTPVNGSLVLGPLDLLINYQKEVCVCVAIGNPKVKKEVISKISRNKNIRFPNLIHPTVDPENEYNSIGMGNIICQGCIITTNVLLKNYIILNLSCTVGHDTVINDYSSFMPGVNISGEVTIHENVYVGTGASIINQVEIGKNAIIGAGAVVFKTIPPDCTAVGIPAKPIKYHNG